jgi:antitoxin component YwqK of YwqJK toxin-antitoxin module
VETHENDWKEGLQKEYYESGKLKIEGSYKNHKREGILKIYHENGELGWEENYINNELEELAKEYYKNGEYRYIDTYKDGKKINRKAYTARGKLEFDQDYPE